MKRISIFCGSSISPNPVFKDHAIVLVKKLVKEGIEIVYGGANVGLMRIIANTALEAGGNVIGVIPGFLRSKEIAHDGLTELIEVNSMHERKEKMDELSDGAIALPGGFGTLDEFFEMLTWGQLGLHKKPVALLNTDGFYDGLMTQFETMKTSGFLKQENLQMVIVNDDIDTLLHDMKAYTPPSNGKWIPKSKS